MKIIALDIGDVWTGTALSDALGITAKPYQTVRTDQLDPFLHRLFEEQKIGIVVVGYPKTMRGVHSQQTDKVVAHKEQLAQQFSAQQFILWDERLTSKLAERPHKKGDRAADKLASHSRAAALILQSYLDYKARSGG